MVWFCLAIGKLEAIPLSHQVEALEVKESRNELVRSSHAVFASCFVDNRRTALRELQGV